MTQNDGGPAFPCAWCDEPSHIKQGRIRLCQMHYRISSMRSRAKRDGKYVPPKSQIEAMAQDMKCIGCCHEMIWLRKEGGTHQATLQHDRDGQVRLLCLGCNVRHSVHPGDTFYEIGSEEKLCTDCQEIKPRQSFCKDASRPLGLKSYCRPCASIRHKNWRSSYAVA